MKKFNVIFDDKNAGLKSLKINGDITELNWIEGQYTFGIPYGKFKVKSKSIGLDNSEAVYEYNSVTLIVSRINNENEYCEKYRFCNNGESDFSFNLGDIGIFTPFNDNYESSTVCMKSRCHSHIWCAENTAYVKCKRMSGMAESLAMVLTKGAVGGYAIERNWDSNDRGDMALLLEPTIIKAGKSIDIELKIFPYTDENDFMMEVGKVEQFMKIEADKYSAAINEIITVKLYTTAENVEVNEGNIKKTEYGYEIKLKYKTKGEYILNVHYDGYRTFAEFYIYENILQEIKNRIDFIEKNQIVRLKGKNYGAIALYDNETRTQYVEDTPVNDRNYARERIGMLTSIIELAKSDLISREERARLLSTIDLCMIFVDKSIVKDNGNVYEKARYKRMIGYDRLYNYSWYMNLYAEMYELKNDKKYIEKAFNIAKIYYKKGGGKFYAINLPFVKVYKGLLKADMTEKAQIVKEWFLNHGNTIIGYGTNYPPHEVKFEQSIVAPAIDILLECYLISDDERYLNEARKQLPILEAFGGTQPSFHINEISIRHWDGYWFGKRKMYGDTFPHYWSCITAMVYSKYSKISGINEYQIKADICLRNNLCLIKNAEGSCAYLYPNIINKNIGKFYDPWANDQDWLMWYNLRFNSGINKIKQ